MAVCNNGTINQGGNETELGNVNNGAVKAVVPGTATITVRTVDDSNP